MAALRVSPSSLTPSGRVKSSYFSGAPGGASFFSVRRVSPSAGLWDSGVLVKVGSGVGVGVVVVGWAWFFNSPVGVLASGLFGSGGSVVTVVSDIGFSRSGYILIGTGGHYVG